MVGSHIVIVSNARLQYKFTVERNITILRGDSATGKTTLIEMISAFQQNGISSGIMVRCDKPCVVLTGNNWQLNLSVIHDSIVFIDEGDRFVKSEAFAVAVQNSDNYYVIATRAVLWNLPYSINEVYGIKNVSGNRYQGTKRLYSEMFPLYPNEAMPIKRPDLVIVEDSNAGYEFFSKIFEEKGIPCVSANGKSNIYDEIVKADVESILVIADGAAFGPEMDRVFGLCTVRDLVLWLPESFEWVILKSGLLSSSHTGEVLSEPSNFIESSVYFSWERFFTALLMEMTKGSYLQYNKRKLNEAYLQYHERSAILSIFPEIL